MLENKPLPNSSEAEAAVLGACLLSESALLIAAEKLTSDHFYHEANRIIFSTMLSMLRSDCVVDLVTLNEKIRENGQLEQIGGMIRIMRLQTDTPTAANIENYISIVLERSIAREVAAMCARFYNEALDGTIDPLQMMTEFQDQAMKLGAGMVTPTLYKPLRLAETVFSHVTGMLDANSHITGLTTGLRDLDYLLGGFKKSDLIIVGARPSIGKSALMLTIARNLILDKKPMVIFSIEMGAKSLGTRLLKLLTGMNLDSYNFLNSHTADQREAIIEGVKRMQELPLYIDDKPNLTGPEFFAKARRYKEEFGCEGIFCDYLQKLQKTNHRLDERIHVTEMVRTMKTSAKMLDIPVIGLSQLTRETDKRSDKRPQIQDFMESGAIEAEADVVIAIHRPEHYGILTFDDELYTPAKGMAELMILKHRNGNIGNVRVRYIKELTLFDDFIPPYESPSYGSYQEAF